MRKPLFLRQDGRTDGWMDEQTAMVKPVYPPQLRWRVV